MNEFLSSTRNYLLNRDDVGKPKPTTHRLPSMEHSYGLPPNKDPEGVKERIESIDSIHNFSFSYWKLEIPSTLSY